MHKIILTLEYYKMTKHTISKPRDEALTWLANQKIALTQLQEKLKEKLSQIQGNFLWLTFIMRTLLLCYFFYILLNIISAVLQGQHRVPPFILYAGYLFAGNFALPSLEKFINILQEKWNNNYLYSSISTVEFLLDPSELQLNYTNMINHLEENLAAITLKEEMINMYNLNDNEFTLFRYKRPNVTPTMIQQDPQLLPI